MAQKIWSKGGYKDFKSQNTRTKAVKQFFPTKGCRKKNLNNNNINGHVTVEERNFCGVPPLNKELWVANGYW